MTPGAARLGLDACDRALALQLAQAAQRYGAGAFDALDLPPVTGGRIDQGLVRVAAVLAWTREVEEAGLPSFVEALAEGLMKGTLPLPVEGGGDRLASYWRARHERFTVDERLELYRRVFGDPREPDGNQFQPLYAGLVGALGGVGRAPDTRPRGDLVIRANVAARDLGVELSLRAAGMASYAARDIVAHVRLALAILADADIARALGATGPWNAIELHGLSVLGRQVTPRRHLERAGAAHAILIWLADSAAAIEGLTARIGPADAVVLAAEAWQALAGMS